MSDDKHTPTPWIVNSEEVNDRETEIISLNHVIAQVKHFTNEYSDFVRSVRVEGEEKELTDVKTLEGKANAARIVQCVNEYDELIETIATLQSEKAELIEALIKIKSIAPIGSTWHYHASQTLAKYETK
jgi:hypothetical protein